MNDKDIALRIALEALKTCEVAWPGTRFKSKYFAEDEVKAAITAIKAALETNEFNPDWDTQAVLTEEIQRMAKRIEELEAKDEPVAKNEEGRITWLVDNWPQNCLLYTHPPQSFTYEQVKAHIRAASMSANDISVGSDTTEDGVSIVIRRRDELLYAEFFAYTPPQRKPLTDDEVLRLLSKIDEYAVRLPKGLRDFARAIEAAHGIKGEYETTN
jgi:hypothetical protein